MADARRLAEVGFAPPLARELASQINAGSGNARRLSELGMVGLLAQLVASFIGSIGSAAKLIALGMIPMQAIELVRQIAGGSLPLRALTFSDGSPLQFSDGNYLELAA